jgi:geranylgeranyl reductase family protein
MAPHYDVVVVGAGPGGSAAAYGLARRGLDVALLDKHEFPRDKTCGDGLSPRALSVLMEMGALDKVLPSSYRVHGLEIQSPWGQTVTAPIPAAPSLPPYALVTPRAVLDDALRQRAVAEGARFQGGLRVTGIETDGRQVRLIGSQWGKTVSIRARAAVIATGASVRLLQRMGLIGGAPPMMLAARGYFEGVDGLNGNLQFHFDGVPLPGYGWLFPLGESRVNVGAGFYRRRAASDGGSMTAHQVLKGFLQSKNLQRVFQTAKPNGPVKGYPLRVDFATAPTFGERVLLAGEAAGLVNPLTGEGVDNALESGKIAAEHLFALLSDKGITASGLRRYDDLLRERFQRQFVFCGLVRDWLMAPLLLDGLVLAARRRADLKMALIRIALGYQDTLEKLTLSNVIKGLMFGGRI